MINAYLNLTSSDVTEYFPTFYLQSAVETITTKPLNVYTMTYPLLFLYTDRISDGYDIDFSFIVSIALALIPASIVSFILKERENQQKHMQMISGVSKLGYWLSNMFSDIVKTYIPILLTMILQAIF